MSKIDEKLEPVLDQVLRRNAGEWTCNGFVPVT